MNYEYVSPPFSDAELTPYSPAAHYYPVPHTDDITELYAEQDFISNFYCCGVQLADMHELVAHFEDCHVMVEGATILHSSAREPISPATASSSTLESPRSAYSPTPPPPNPFPTLTAAFTPPESAFAPVYVKTPPSSEQSYSGYPYTGNAYGSFIQPEGQYIVDGVSYDHTPVPSLPLTIHPQDSIPATHYFSNDSNQTACVPPSHTLAEYPDPPSNAMANGYPPTLAPTPVYARHPNLSIITDLPPELSDPIEKPSGETSATWATESDGDEKLPHTRRRKKAPSAKHHGREKTHKCPHAGCVKSYLNANGLKYHLNKGVCEFIS
ncbi:hypothetical protein M422DRAFT_244683 [Sphaerobolus stellatus SS14]|nr:hypothetical protein M422DRAFT_244683 [Sphaerobolus stellatus SS14]